MNIADKVYIWYVSRFYLLFIIIWFKSDNDNNTATKFKLKKKK